MKLFSRRTKLINIHRAPIMGRGMKNGGIIKKFDVTIPSGGCEYVYYSDLNIEYNYSEPYVNAFVEGAENAKTTVSTSMVRDNEILVFNYTNGNITCSPIEGNFLARTSLFNWFISPSPIPQHSNLITLNSILVENAVTVTLKI